ncbi:MAG: hypothetical protein Q4G69_03690 [Planctomycetia bacterium]|nr:hypothetical protein [Planctomycetia bacterium]
MRKNNRREFMKCSLSAGSLMIAGSLGSLSAKENGDEIGKPLSAWKEGEMDIHYIYTGVGENMFLIFPDGTSMILDSSDRLSNQEDQFPVLPDKSRLPSEWIARYIQRVNPAGKKIDYMMLSHYHSDHAGSSQIHARKTTGRTPDYCLSGLANLGEIFSIDTVYDRGYPHYERTAKDADDFMNFRKFTEWKVKNGDFRMEEFLVGKKDQIVLRKNKSAWPDFHTRNICANGIVWTGEEGKNADFFADPEFKKYRENAMSIGFTIDFGPFRYFTGGDISGDAKSKDCEGYLLEGAVGKAAGIVDVCKTNHHSYKDAMRPDFTKEVQAHVYITNVWDRGHLQDNTMINMTDSSLYQGDRIVSPTWVSQKQMDENKDKSWQKFLKPAYGHVVLRVFDGGRQYKIFHLVAEDESMKIKAVFGPFRSKKSL